MTEEKMLVAADYFVTFLDHKVFGLARHQALWGSALLNEGNNEDKSS